MRPGRFIAPLLAAALLWGGAAAADGGADTAPRGLSVLLLSSFQHDLPFARRIEDGLDQALQYRAGQNALFVEHLDGGRFDTGRFAGLFAQTLAAKYGDRRLDAVIVWGATAQRFLIDHWDALTPQRVIGIELTPRAQEALRARAPDALMVRANDEYGTALRIALQVGQAGRLALIGESMGDSGQARLRGTLAGWDAQPEGLVLENLFNMPLDQVVERIKNLPPDSVVYYTPVSHNEHGAPLRPLEALARLAAASPVPLFSQWETFIGPGGAAGGYVLSGEALGRLAGQIAAAAVRGDGAALTALQQTSPYRLLFDAKRMAHWRVPESRLPAGAEVQNRPPSLWREHHDAILAGGGAIVGMALFSLLLLRLLASRQKLVRELAAERAQLAGKVAARTRDLEAKAGELARSNDELESFAYAISHDLRAPLRTIRSYISLLTADLGDRLNDEEKEWSGFIRSGADRLDGMIHGLLEYSRAGRREHDDHTPTRLQDAAAAVLDALDLPRQIAGARVVLTAPDNIPPVSLDRQNAERLIQNLVENALKYRHPDRAPAVDISIAMVDGRVQLAVRDNGLGVAPNQQERIFGLFQRIHTDRPGFGVGLALCRRIMDSCGGRIWVESQLGEGSVFYADFASSA